MAIIINKILLALMFISIQTCPVCNNIKLTNLPISVLKYKNTARIG